MFNKLKEFLYLKGIDKNKVDFLVKILVISIYADKEINQLEIETSKKIIKNYINQYYYILSKNKKDFIIDYLINLLFKELKKIKKNPDYFERLKEECLIQFKKEQNRIYFIEKMVDIFKADSVFAEDEKNMLKSVKDFIKRIKKNEKSF